jgi:hypothetical protein
MPISKLVLFSHLTNTYVISWKKNICQYIYICNLIKALSAFLIKIVPWCSNNEKVLIQIINVNWFTVVMDLIGRITTRFSATVIWGRELKLLDDKTDSQIKLEDSVGRILVVKKIYWLIILYEHNAVCCLNHLIKSVCRDSKGGFQINLVIL